MKYIDKNLQHNDTRCTKYNEPVLRDEDGKCSLCGATINNNAMNNDLKQFIKLGYGDTFNLEVRSLNFTTERMSAEVAREAVAMIQGYNGYNGARAAEAIEKVAKLWQSDRLSFEFGRESSPVLYINIPYWLNDERMNEAMRNDYIEKTIKIFNEIMPADECDVEKGNGRLRLWWD